MARHPTMRTHRRPLLEMALALFPLLALPATDVAAQGRGGRGGAEITDTARAARLFVSDRAEDHPQANFERQIESKAATDSIFAARAAGIMDYRKITYRSRVGDMDIPAYVYQPLEKRGPRGHAAMIWVHGGVHGNWDQNYWPFIEEAVERGYVVIAPEYRGSTGYGADHYNAIDYGGYITLLSTMREQGPFAAAVAMVPVTNLIFRLSYKGPSYQRSFSTQSRIQGLPFEQREIYVDRSPYYHVHKLNTPLLVHVATNDTDVNYEEASMLVWSLRAQKPDLAETKIYVDPPPGRAGRGHTFNRRVDTQTLERMDTPEQRDSWNRVWTFFELHLRPYEAIPERAAPRSVR